MVPSIVWGQPALASSQSETSKGSCLNAAFLGSRSRFQIASRSAASAAYLDSRRMSKASRRVEEVFHSSTVDRPISPK